MPKSRVRLFSDYAAFCIFMKSYVQRIKFFLVIAMHLICVESFILQRSASGFVDFCERYFIWNDSRTNWLLLVSDDFAF